MSRSGEAEPAGPQVLEFSNEGILSGMMRAASHLQVAFGTFPLEEAVGRWEYATGKQGETICVGFTADCVFDADEQLTCSFVLQENIELYIPAEQVARRIVTRARTPVARKRRAAFERANAFSRLLRREYAISTADPELTSEHLEIIYDDNDFRYWMTDLREGPLADTEYCKVSETEECEFDNIVTHLDADRINGMLRILDLPPCDEIVA